MPEGNFLKFILKAVALLWTGSLAAQSQPIVIGYERFHKEEATIEGGRILFNELGCVNCHNPQTDLPQREGPLLTGILERTHPEYLSRFLKDPAKSKPGTTMPHMRLTETEIDAIIHYLGTLDSEKDIPKAFRFVNAERGMSLYHERGCAACHQPSPDHHPADGVPNQADFSYPHVPLPNLKEKYDFDSLSAFLYNPHDFWPQGRMPKFELEREDGGDLTAFLLGFQNGDSTEYPSIGTFNPDPTKAWIGKEVVSAYNCAACHTFPDSEKLTPATKDTIRSLSNLRDDHPDYSLSESQTASLQLFLKSANGAPSPATTHLQTLNCMACHTRNDLGGPDAARSVYFSGDSDLGDTGKMPPPLTGVGEKLLPDWLNEAVRSSKKVRPYLNVQMPDFGPSVEGLAETLIRDDDQADKIEVSEKHLEEGRKLLGTQGGLNCITCHNWGERKSMGIRALDLSTLAERLQPDWLHDYLIDPSIHRPNTLMPSFWPQGIASNQEILSGNTTDQIKAIYAFSKWGEGLPEGFSGENTADFEIVPTDRPIIQRSFMEGIGTHAILVGFPEGVHLAFNGKTGEPAALWKGRFFDAYRTWFSRFPEFEKPLGADLVTWPDSKFESDRSYRGYRLDSAGVPEFVVMMNKRFLFERFAPLEEAGGSAIQRTIRYTQVSQLADPSLRHPESVSVKELDVSDPMTRSFIYTW